MITNGTLAVIRIQLRVLGTFGLLPLVGEFVVIHTVLFLEA